MEEFEEEPIDYNRGRKRKVLFGLIAFLVCLWFVPWVPKLFLPSIEVTRLDSKGKPFQEMVGPKTKNWVELEKVSKHFRNAIITAEDGKFYQHHGIDLGEIYASYKINKKKGRYVRGGSTITQQVVKMTCLSREKTMIRKVREIVGALLLELMMSKDDILEWYINLTEFGGGIYGVSAAGLHYFKTKPQLLTIEQSIALVTVIPSPTKWSAGLRKRDLSEFGQKRFTSIASKMLRSGYLTKMQWENALYVGNFGRPLLGYQKTVKVDPMQEEQIDDPADDALNDLSDDALETYAPPVQLDPSPQISAAPVETASPTPSQ